MDFSGITLPYDTVFAAAGIVVAGYAAVWSIKTVLAVFRNDGYSPDYSKIDEPELYGSHIRDDGGTHYDSGQSDFGVYRDTGGFK